MDSQDDMPDVSNGVKYGQSQAFNLVPPTTDIHMFRRMAFGSSGTNSFDSEKYNRYSTAVFEAESTNQRGRTETRAQGSSSGKNYQRGFTQLINPRLTPEKKMYTVTFFIITELEANSANAPFTASPKLE